MNKISCNVTKDLLPVYLDDICSEESKTLVEKHLQECEECKQFLEEIKAKEVTYNHTEETTLFFQKIKKYLDTRNKVMFFISLLLTLLIAIYSEINYRYIPDVIVYVTLPILMCTFFLTEPMQQHTTHEKKRKWYILPCLSVTIALFLTGFHFVFLKQLTILFTSSNTDQVWGIFRLEPSQLGPFVEKIYLVCIFAEIFCLFLYFLFGQRDQNSFILGQNASWLGLGLGIMYRETLYRMDTLEGFQKLSLTITGILFAEFMIAYALNLLHAKVRKNRW